jgi:hypothetical protein
MIGPISHELAVGAAAMAAVAAKSRAKPPETRSLRMRLQYAGKSFHG